MSPRLTLTSVPNSRPVMLVISSGRALEGIPEGDGAQSATQVALANRLVEVLDEHGAVAQICAPSDSAQYVETEISGQKWASSSIV